MTQYRIFFSHGGDDTYIVKDFLRPQVERTGATVFLDTGRIEYGEDFRRIILAELRSCDELLVLLTPSSLKRPWVMAEIGAILVRGKRVIRYGPSEGELQELGILSLLGSVSLLRMGDFEEYVDNLGVELRSTAMHDVYLSYSSEDQQAAEVIAHRLSSEGFSVFLDHDVLVAGHDWSARTIAEIRSSKAILALLSLESRKNKWVAEELQAALDTKKLVVPVLLDKEAKENWLWPLLATRDSVELDLRSPNGRSQLDELVRRLSLAIGKPAALRMIPVPLVYVWAGLAAAMLIAVAAGFYARSQTILAIS